MPNQTASFLGSLRGLLATLFAAPLLGLTAAPALALDGLWDAQRFSPTELPKTLLPAPFAFGPENGDSLLVRTLGQQDDFAFAGLVERLHRIPLRPVVLGDTPRTPVDPDRSLGLVVQLPFSL
jgi:hypothetical protein